MAIKFKNIIFGAIASLTISLASFTSLVSAKRAIVLSPTGQRIVLVPGENFKGSIRVTNPSDATEDLYYSVSVGSYGVNGTANSRDDYGEADIDTISDYNAIMDWISIDKPEGILAPNEEGTVAFTIKVPKDAPAGGQYATLLIKDVTPSEVSEGALGISETIQMASVIYAEVSGETRKVGEVTENSLPIFLMNNELEATSMVRNDGNVHTSAEYTLQVWPMFSDEEICTNEENVATSLIMPNTERYHTESCTLPTVGIFRAKQVVKIFGTESIVEKTIIVCPLWLMSVIIFIIAALIIWIVLRTKNRKNK